MLDAIHDYLLLNLACRMGRAASSGEDGSDAEVLFMEALQMIEERQDELTEDDLAMVGEWLHEAEEYFQHDDDLVVVEHVLSRDRARSGRQVRDLRPFVAAARAARERRLSNRSSS